MAAWLPPSFAGAVDVCVSRRRCGRLGPGLGLRVWMLPRRPPDGARGAGRWCRQCGRGRRQGVSRLLAPQAMIQARPPLTGCPSPGAIVPPPALLLWWVARRARARMPWRSRIARPAMGVVARACVLLAGHGGARGAVAQVCGALEERPPEKPCGQRPRGEDALGPEIPCPAACAPRQTPQGGPPSLALGICALQAKSAEARGGTAPRTGPRAPRRIRRRPWPRGRASGLGPGRAFGALRTVAAGGAGVVGVVDSVCAGCGAGI